MPEKSKQETVAIATKERFAELERVAREVNVLSLAKIESRFEQASVLATGILKLEEALDPSLMKGVMALQNHSLGFRTDQERGYPEAVVRRCLIEATMRGLLPVGNQFNILAGRQYTTKEGFNYLLDTFPGLTDRRETYGVPQLAGARAIVKCKATWKLNGEADELEAEIPIIVNSGMRDDAILGKAERKLLARVYKRVTQAMKVLPPADGDADEDLRVATARNVTPATQDRRPLTTQGLFATPEEKRLAELAAEAEERDAKEAAAAEG